MSLVHQQQAALDFQWPTRSAHCSIHLTSSIRISISISIQILAELNANQSERGGFICMPNNKRSQSARTPLSRPLGHRSPGERRGGPLIRPSIHSSELSEGPIGANWRSKCKNRLGFGRESILNGNECKCVREAQISQLNLAIDCVCWRKSHSGCIVSLLLFRCSSFCR